MGPTDIIREWFEAEDREIQSDVATLVAIILNNLRLDPDQDGMIAQLSAWLTPTGENKYRTIGKALSFIAAFEFMFGSRFADEGWDRPRRLFEKVIEENEDEGMTATSRRMLDDLPRRQKLWGEVGKRWEAVKARLSHDALEDWVMRS